MISRETVIKAINCCIKQNLEACEKCPLEGKCHDGKVLLEACKMLLKKDGHRD